LPLRTALLRYAFAVYYVFKRSLLHTVAFTLLHTFYHICHGCYLFPLHSTYGPVCRSLRYDVYVSFLTTSLPIQFHRTRSTRTTADVLYVWTPFSFAAHATFSAFGYVYVCIFSHVVALRFYHHAHVWTHRLHTALPHRTGSTPDSFTVAFVAFPRLPVTFTVVRYDSPFTSRLPSLRLLLLRLRLLRSLISLRLRLFLP